jgi:hypothetical protein
LQISKLVNIKIGCSDKKQPILLITNWQISKSAN